MSGIALGIGLALSVGATVYSAAAQARMAEEQKEASLTAENARRQQMQLDANRRRREAIRQSLLARSTALTVGTAQGAGQGSGVAGAMAQATATGNQQIQTTNAAEHLGDRVFDANRQYAEATARGQKAMAWGSALGSIGGVLMNNAGTIGRLGAYYTTPRYA